MSKKAATKEPELPGIDIMPMKWYSVVVHPDGGVIPGFHAYVSARPLKTEEAEKLYLDSRLTALKEAKVVLDREIAEMEKGAEWNKIA